VNLQSGVVVLLEPESGTFLILSPFVLFTDHLKGVPDVFLLNTVAKNRAIYASAQFRETLDTGQWEDGAAHRKALAGFLDRLRMTDSLPDDVELDLDAAPSVEDDSRFSTAEVFLSRQRPTKPAPVHKSPFKFLDYYDPEDADIFFGRQRESGVLFRKFHNARLLTLHGESGTGKTSLIRAGLIPMLPSDAFVPVYVRVLKEPLREVKKELIRQLDRDDRHIDLPLADFLMKETELLSKTVVIVLDQFEEFFLRFPEEIRERFASQLAACVHTAHLDARFLISLRADYFSHLAAFESAIPQIFTHQVQLEHLPPAQALEAIVRPVETVGMTIDEELVKTRLLPELTGDEGVEPPLLQIVCDALYQNALGRDATGIGPEDYEAAGDVRGALTNYLDARLKQFGKEQPKARAALKALVTAEGTKRASFAGELVSRIRSMGIEINEAELTSGFLDKFIRDRLVRVEDADGAPRYELSHEYMVRRIQEWIEESEREVTKILELIDRAYEAYQATGLLLEASALGLIQPVEAQLRLTPEKEAFVNRSRKQAKRKRRGLFLKVGMLLLVVAMIVGGVFGYQAYEAYQEALRQERIAKESLKEARNNMGLIFTEKAERALDSYNHNEARLFAYHALKFFNQGTLKSREDKSLSLLLRTPDHPILFTFPIGSHHVGPINSVCFSPDGKTLASGSENNLNDSKEKTIRLWDVETGEEKTSFSAYEGSVSSVTFSPDGKTLASGCHDNTIRLWDVETGKEKSVLKGFEGIVYSVNFSPDGRTLAAGYADRIVRLWNVRTGEEEAVLSGHADTVFSVCFSPYGNTLASGSADGTTRLWDVESGKAKAVLDGEAGYVLSVRFSPDSKVLASGLWDNTIQLWDIETRRKKAVISGHRGVVLGVDFSQDGKILASGSRDKTVRLWDVETGKEKATFRHADDVNSVSFSPNANILASGSKDNTIRLWDMEVKKHEMRNTGHTGEISSVTFSHDGKIMASGSYDNTIRLWDVKTGKEKSVLIGHEDYIESVKFSPSGKTLVSGSWDNTIRLWVAKTGEEKAKLNGHGGIVRSVCFAPDEKTIASGSYDHTVRLWDVETGKEKAMFSDHEGAVLSVAFSPTGKTLASGSLDETIRLWDVETGKAKATLRGHAGSVWSVNFSPNGKTLAVGCDDNTIRLWGVETQKEKAVLSGHAAQVSNVNFSPDGKSLASASDDDTIRLWDVETGKQKATLSGHAGHVLSVNFSPDGKTLLSGGSDHAIRIWDIVAGEKGSVIKGKGRWREVSSVSFSPDGKTLASGFNDDTIRLWDLETGKEKVRISVLDDYRQFSSMKFSPDGETIATGTIEDRYIQRNRGIHDRPILLWDAKTGELKATLGEEKGSVSILSFSPDGKILASQLSNKFSKTSSNTIRLWEVKTGKEMASLNTITKTLSFSPDSKTLASASSDKAVRLWNIETGEKKAILRGHAGGINSVCFSPDGKTLASGSLDDTIIIWDVENKQKKTVLNGHTGWVYSVSFSPDGKILASGSFDTTIRLWNLETGQEEGRLIGQKGPVLTINFSPDGKTLASKSFDSIIRIWDLSNLYDSRPIEEKIKEAEKKYNLTRVGLELQPIPPKRRLYNPAPPPPRWPKTHPFHWRSAAESGDAEAMIELGIIYDRDNELDKAWKWYNRALNAGSPRAEERIKVFKQWLTLHKDDYPDAYGKYIANTNSLN
jgi:WD40 repeat protein